MKRTILLLSTISALSASAQTPVLISDINLGASASNPALTTVFNDKLYFAADDGTNGRELMVWDGTNTPTLVYNLNSGNANGFNPGSYNTKMAVFNGKLYFGANNGTAGSELMVYDGVNPPTLVADINPGNSGSNPYWLYVSGNKLLFDATTAASGFELFVYDGVSAPVLFDLNPGVDMGDPYSFMEYNGKVYFKATNATSGAELFAYNPVNNTAVLAADINAGGGSSLPTALMVHGNKLYFTASTPTHGRELYSYDGTTATRLTDINNGVSNSINSQLVTYNNQIYFGAAANNLADQLYKYDPQFNTVSLVYNVNPGNSSEISLLHVYGDKLYFNAYTQGSGNELWVHDGTTTTMVADINPGTSGSDPRDFVVYDGKLCFAATHASTGTELYSLTDPALSVKNIKLDGAVVLMPNPTSGDATLQLSLNSAASLGIR